jgi:glutamate-ammonia-ligase adenylyltransferase
MLESVPFRHPELAQRNLIHLDRFLSPPVRDLLAVLLQQSSDPDSALNYLDRYLSSPGEAPALPSGSRLHALLAVFAHSHFLSETVFRRPELLDDVLAPGNLYRVLTGEELRAALSRFPVGAMDHPTVALELARFKRRNLLRVVLRDVLGLATLAELTLELSTLADTLLDAALERVIEELAAVHGRPWVADHRAPCEFTVLALGKLGGQELNYSSDIDLMFLYSAPGETDGARKITAREFSTKVASQVTGLLSSVTPEGFCYRVDLRLRPEGRLGEIALPLEAALDYYQGRARDWELQMLIKARVAAGSRSLGRRFLDSVEPLIYKTTTDFSAVESVAETRERIHEKLRRRAPAGLDIKLTRGGIRDIEFLVQCLQRLYGGRDPWVRHGGTLFAMHRLRDKGYLGARDFARLQSAYHFLRTLEHRLQIAHDRQVHTLPQESEALEVLAAKMGLGRGAGASADILLSETRRHLGEVAEIYDRLIHGHGPPDSSLPETQPMFQLEMARAEELSEMSMQAELRFLEKRAPELAARVAAATLSRGRRLFEHFLGKVISNPELLAAVEPRPQLIDLAADLFEHSPYFAEALIRNPEEIHELLEVAAFTPSEQQASLFAIDPSLRRRDHPELEHLIRTRAPLTDKTAWLRRFYRRQMLRIQSESLCGAPIFSTLEQTTELADWVVAAAYQVAIHEVLRSDSPEAPLTAPSQHPMHVVALGRLGMREFDLGSDADLVFILPDPAQQETSFWTRVAERMIDVLTSYTGEGVIFSVDTRLRPLGREGELVQTESRYKQYFDKQAGAWEAITYMKSRCLAGDVERGTAFLNELQNVDWRRYGQSGTLAALLADMRRRLEREQGLEQPLKAGRGGYYDIDFVLMYLRLRGAGIFYRSLNTPERIEVIERMGLLNRENAEFLRSAAVFYRALDHGLRLSTGRSHGSLPTAPSQVEILTELVRRWTPASLHERPLDELLAEMRRRTRDTFDQIFGSQA